MKTIQQSRQWASAVISVIAVVVGGFGLLALGVQARAFPASWLDMLRSLFLIAVSIGLLLRKRLAWYAIFVLGVGSIADYVSFWLSFSAASAVAQGEQVLGFYLYAIPLVFSLTTAAVFSLPSIRAQFLRKSASP